MSSSEIIINISILNIKVEIIIGFIYIVIFFEMIIKDSKATLFTIVLFGSVDLLGPV